MPARQAVLPTPSEFSALHQLLSCQHFVRISLLAATLMDLTASVANKRLTAKLTLLDATLTKNTGEGSRLLLTRNPHFSPSSQRGTYSDLVVKAEVFFSALSIQSSIPLLSGSSTASRVSFPYLVTSLSVYFRIFSQLTFCPISSQMDVPKETVSLDRTTNEHSRRHYRQAHQDQRRARRTDRHPGRHPHLRLGRAQFRRLRAGSRPQLADSARPARRAVHHPHQRRHHYAAGHRLLFLSPDDRRLSHRWRFLHRRALQPRRLRSEEHTSE